MISLEEMNNFLTKSEHEKIALGKFQFANKKPIAITQKIWNGGWFNFFSTKDCLQKRINTYRSENKI